MSFERSVHIDGTLYQTVRRLYRIVHESVDQSCFELFFDATGLQLLLVIWEDADRLEASLMHYAIHTPIVNLHKRYAYQKPSLMYAYFPSLNPSSNGLFAQSIAICSLAIPDY